MAEDSWERQPLTRGVVFSALMKEAARIDRLADTKLLKPTTEFSMMVTKEALESIAKSIKEAE